MNSKQAQAIIHKTRVDYNRIARHFSATRVRVWPEFEYLKTFLGDDQTILDWGCGSGRFILGLQDKKNIKYFGIDQSDELIKIARETYATEVKAGWAKFYSTTLQAQKFPDNFFDLEFLISSFFHLPDENTRLSTLQELYRVIKPDGKIVILVWNLGSDWAKEKLKKDWKKIGENDFIVPWKNQQGEVISERYYHHFTSEELSGLLIKAGFKNVKIKYSDATWSDDKGGRNMFAVAVK
jgi:ubiquinone/menaquinone biosynthesis C-methylase UbiE